jgi:uncharacterized membrane protein YphA (DoxX/SURF4 family)/peroxiredoxin
VGSLLVGIRLALAAVFAVAGVAKLLDRKGSERSLAEFGVPARALRAGAVLLPLCELATAVALIFPGSARWGGVAALVLLLSFVAGIANAMRRGQAPDCHCFGQLHSAPAGRRTIARNAGLAVLSAFVVVRGPGPSIADWVSARSPAELVAVALGLAAVGLGGLATRLWLERRDLRRDLAAAQERIAGLPAGLPVGAPAPQFALPDVDGTIHTLDSLRSRGLPLALIFVSPECGPCHSLFPELGRWQAALTDRITLAVISQGTAVQHRPLVAEHGLVNVLLDEDAKVMGEYRVTATPGAVAVTPQGTIGSSVALSDIAIEPLVRLILRGGAAPTTAPGAVSAELPLT